MGILEGVELVYRAMNRVRIEAITPEEFRRFMNEVEAREFRYD